MSIKFLSFAALAGSLLLLSSCVRPVPTPDPTAIPIAQMADQESDPRRAASMRVVEKGRQELKKGFTGRAAHQFSRSLEIDPANPFGYFFQGVARFKVGRFDQAANLFSRSSDLFGDLKIWSAESLAYRGECFENLGKLEMAKKEFEQALDLDAGNSRARQGYQRLR